MYRIRLVALAMALLVAACSQGGPPTNSGAVADDEADAEDQTDAQSPRTADADSPLLDATQSRAPAGKARPLPPGAMRAQLVQIMDMNGFAQPLPALFAFVPMGWRPQGGVQWGNQFMCTNGYNFNWFAQSPDGLQTVAILPQENWQTTIYGGGTNNPGCRSMPISSIQQYLQQVVGRGRTGARVLDFRPRPDLAAKLSNLNMRTPSAMGEMRTWVESGQVLFAFNEQGRDMRGLLTATAVFSLSRMSGLGQGQTMDALSASVLPGFAATAPNGQLNLQFAEAIRQSFVANPAWQAAISSHNTRIAQGAAQEIAKRGKIIAEYNDYVSLIRKEVAATRAKSEDTRNREFGELIRGNETYDDANAPGGQVELSNMYDNAWRLNDGSYVLSNDASFEPWRDLGLEGRQLQRTQ